jgi:hypothetical protein
MSPYDPESRSAFHNIVRLIVRVGLSFALSWFIAGVMCSLLLAFHLRAFDFVCGHNVYIQLPFLIIGTYLLLGLFPPLRFHSQQVSSHGRE